jgi:photosystem II stability/assembly factor-like uncharacterized protein
MADIARVLLGTTLIAGAALAAPLAAPLAAQQPSAPAAGGSWTLQTSNTTASLRGLHAVSPTVVWASGSRGTVLRTSDGGTTWRATTVAGADSLDFRDIHAMDSLRAVIVSAGQPARIYRTEDGGSSWTMVHQATDTTAFFDGLAFWSAERGIVYSDPVGGSFHLLTTADGGRTWTPVPPSALPAPQQGEASFAASGTGIVVDGKDRVWFSTGGAAVARVYRSTDGGRSWAVAETPVVAGDAGAGIFSLAFLDARRGVAVGGNYRLPTADSANVALTADGGRTWRVPTGRRPGGYRSGAAVVPGASKAIVVAVGTSGSDVSTDGGASWTPLDTTGFNAVHFAGKDAGWAVGDRGRVARWNPEAARKVAGF